MHAMHCRSVSYGDFECIARCVVHRTETVAVPCFPVYIALLCQPQACMVCARHRDAMTPRPRTRSVRWPTRWEPAQRADVGSPLVSVLTTLAGDLLRFFRPPRAPMWHAPGLVSGIQHPVDDRRGQPADRTCIGNFYCRWNAMRRSGAIAQDGRWRTMQQLRKLVQIEGRRQRLDHDSADRPRRCVRCLGCPTFDVEKMIK